MRAVQQAVQREKKQAVQCDCTTLSQYGTDTDFGKHNTFTSGYSN